MNLQRSKNLKMSPLSNCLLLADKLSNPTVQVFAMGLLHHCHIWHGSGHTQYQWVRLTAVLALLHSSCFRDRLLLPAANAQVIAINAQLGS